MRLHFPVLEQVSFNRDLVVHIPYAHRPPITRRSPPYPYVLPTNCDLVFLLGVLLRE